MPASLPPGGFNNSLELRQKNRATVDQYMRTNGEDRLRRHELFTPDGSGGSWNTETGEPLVFKGHAKLAALGVWLHTCFPDWQWHNVRVFETDNPNHFWVESDGRGTTRVPGYPEGYCENHYIHSFELDNGKITQNREFMNPFAQLRALGIAVPTIKREGIPAS
ncbi:Phenazine biosynthesis protein PhzA [Pseudomonas orientalis]|uniref:PhzA/PhzB family protein n=1 Tax=Pseudomonas orientalis TaxID=76758 RepID=UPI000F57F965|nr:PhzA/PhzB family protein [Pseudomonas orientalis]AZE83926.1 Phenazine biosynthesis protein PhzA [Pseudomonas orientalis]